MCNILFWKLVKNSMILKQYVVNYKNKYIIVGISNRNSISGSEETYKNKISIRIKNYESFLMVSLSINNFYHYRLPIFKFRKIMNEWKHHKQNFSCSWRCNFASLTQIGIFFVRVVLLTKFLRWRTAGMTSGLIFRHLKVRKDFFLSEK